MIFIAAYSYVAISQASFDIIKVLNAFRDYIYIIIRIADSDITIYLFYYKY